MNAAQIAQPEVFMQDFLTKFGSIIQVSGFFGWFILGFVAIAMTVALFMIAVALLRASKDFSRYVDSVAGPVQETPAVVTEASPPASPAKKGDVVVDEFVE